MADLDNFFAKKDRKKTKGQKFATSTDNMATSQEELLKKQEKQKKERTLLQNIHSSENDKSSGRKEEEWKDYSEEIKDYTTLKIQNLTTDSNTNYSDNSDKDNEIEFEENEAGEMIPKRKNTGPWKVSDIEPIPPPKAPEPVVKEKVEVKNNVYIPPGQRNFQGGHRSAPRSKTGLDVKDEDMFPTLQGNSTKKSIAPLSYTAKKPETLPTWSKYQ